MIISANILALYSLVIGIMLQGITPVVGEWIIVGSITTDSESNFLGWIKIILGLQIYVVGIVVAVSSVDSKDIVAIFIRIIAVKYGFEQGAAI